MLISYNTTIKSIDLIDTGGNEERNNFLKEKFDKIIKEVNDKIDNDEEKISYKHQKPYDIEKNINIKDNFKQKGPTCNTSSFMLQFKLTERIKNQIGRAHV